MDMASKQYYRIQVGGSAGRTFELSRETLSNDSPNHFTAAFLGGFSESTTTDLHIDRDPNLFEFIVRYLQGYTIMPITESPLPNMSLEVFKANLLADAQFYGLSGLMDRLDPPTASPTGTPTPPPSPHITIWNPLKQRHEILVPLRNVDAARLRFGEAVLFTDDEGVPVVARFVAREVLCKLSLAQYATTNNTTFTHVLFTYSNEKEKEAIVSIAGGFNQEDIGSSNLLDACFDIKGLLFTGKDVTECEWLLECKPNIPSEEYERLNRLRWLIARGGRTVSLFLDQMLFTVERAVDQPCMMIVSARGIRQEEYGWRTSATGVSQH
ncbi:hypothetical protein SeMB42_g00913 [Synchytrium endobioticum]|uniref:Potassium channel tetramerisation-type BTB domain-containing protein n=1 Tax=Synchytrium endobioticum TaxID=286115 RepID=A0A507CCQ4_9FUNG|nr:hypothetical protein SeLEV6574_g07940 [Synchytrium endobioticum]TPX53208.1 hypothetical protein SeMB42_g00913 [Synchytrium endobioticum]